MKNPPKHVKDARDKIHFINTVSPMQIARMRSGRVESRPEDYAGRVSELDRERAKVRKALEERAELRELERACGSGYE